METDRATNLTDRAIKSFKPKTSAYDKKDKQVPGLRMRVLPSGQKTFVLLARYPGPNPHPTRRALGSYGELTLEETRAKANARRVLIKRGVDPAAEERRQRFEQGRRQENTFAAIANAYFAEVLPKQRRGAHVKRDIIKVFIDEAGWGARPIHEITALDVRGVIRRYAEQGKLFHTYNLLSYLRRVFNWAIEQQCYGIETSPCGSAKARHPYWPQASAYPRAERYGTSGRVACRWQYALSVWAAVPPANATRPAAHRSNRDALGRGRPGCQDMDHPSRAHEGWRRACGAAAG